MIGKPSAQKKEKLLYGFVIAGILGVLAGYAVHFHVLAIVIFLAALVILYYVTDRTLTKSYNYEKGSVAPLDEKGFAISRGNGFRNFYWKDLEEFSWLGTWLCFDFKNGETICFKETLEGTRKILPTIPEEKATENALEVIRLTLDETGSISGVETCEICGFMAVEESSVPTIWCCYVCFNEPWSKDHPEPHSTYVRNRALDFFATENETEKVNFHPAKEYQQDATWTLPVSEEEVLAYSREQWPKVKVPIDQSKSLPCMVCGFFSIPHPADPAAQEDADCRICFSPEWHVGLGPNEMDFLYECQLDHFATWDPEEKVVFYPKDTGYRPVPHWRPRVTEQEVLAYSKKENWG